MEESRTESRVQRRNAARAVGNQKKKNKPWIVTAAAAGAVVAAATTVAGLAYANRSVPLHETPEMSAYTYFADTKFPEGWTQEKRDAPAGITGLAYAQSPLVSTNAEDTCSYMTQTFYLPSHMAGRGDDFLTRDYIYQTMEASGIASKALETYAINVDEGGKLDFLRVDYLTKSNLFEPADNEKDEAKETKVLPDVYRAMAVRALDKLVPMESHEDNATTDEFGSPIDQGLPLFVLTYECESQGDFSGETWNELLDGTTVSIANETEPAVPAKQEPAETAKDDDKASEEPTDEPSKESTEKPSEEPTDKPTDEGQAE